MQAVDRGAVVLTGAASGLGRELSLGLAGAGYPVVGLGRSRDALAAVEAEVSERGGSFRGVVGDARDRGVLAEALRIADETGLYGVIANAGIAGPTAPIEEVSDEEWQETFEVNVTAVYRLCAEAAGRLRQRGRGRIVIVGSVTGKRPLPGRTPYAASKLALVGLARTLAVELGPAGTTVNVVSPWMLEGARLDRVIEKQAALRGLAPARVEEEMLAGTATGLAVSADDVLAAIEYLLDPRSRNITGQDINVSSGAVMY